MKSWIAVAVVALVVPIGAVALGSYASDEPKTEEIMKGLFSKKAGKFSNALKTTKEIHELGAMLEKAEPEKGSKESWKKLAGKFGENTKALHEAAEAKELDKVKAAQKSIGGSCKACHDAHKGQ